MHYGNILKMVQDRETVTAEQ